LIETKTFFFSDLSYARSIQTSFKFTLQILV